MQADLQQTMTHAAMPTHHDRDSIERYLNSPVTFDLVGEILKASNTLLNFTSDNAIEGADSIPRDLIAEAKGLAFITFFKLGLFVTARVGTGLVVARRRDGGWSAPSALGSAGVGWGFQIGGELTDVVIVLNTVAAVEAFTSTGQLSLGTELSLSVGPVGRTASTDVRAGDGGVTAAFSYAHSKGIFIGVSVEAATVVTRKEANRDFYGMHISAKELLMGDFPPPKAAEPLYKALEEVESNIRVHRNRPPPPPKSSPPPGPHGSGGASSFYAPFKPEAEDHLRSFTLTPEEKKQMEEDYMLAVAMQKGEAVAGAAGSGLGEAPALASGSAGASSFTSSSTIFSRFSKGVAGRGGVAPDRDEWEMERRVRIEQARRAEAEEAVAADNELGEIGSFVNGAAKRGSKGAQELSSEPPKMASVATVDHQDKEEEEDESSDDDEYRRDIAQFASRRKAS
ncbi:unnamed protein product [Ascophyllum nodosum]